MHSQTADFESAVRQEILNKILQTLATVAHVLQDFALSLAQRPKLLAMQKLNVSVQDGQWCFEIVSGGCKCIGCALKAFPKLLVFLEKVFRTWNVLVGTRDWT